jgi:hypothetical protein
MVDKLQSLIKDIQDNFLDEETLIDQYCRYEGRTPLEVLEEKESRKEVVEVLQWLLENLPQDDKEILIKWIIEGKSLDQVAIETRKAKSSIQYRIERIPVIIEKKFVQMVNHNNYSRDTFIQEKQYDAHSPTPLGYPYEIAKSSSKGGYWGMLNKKRRSVYRTKLQCKIPEYLQTCFHDDKTICNICNKCKRKKTTK